MIPIFFAVLILVAGCDDTKQAGDNTARELTGSNMLKQEQKAQQQIEVIKQQQQQRIDEMDQQ